MRDPVHPVKTARAVVGRGDILSRLLGAAEYAAIATMVEDAFADPAVRGVLLELDSPGGEVGGLFDLAARLSASKQHAGKPLWAIASESALSAAYLIASAADRLYVTQTGEAGSIGVVAVHLDASGADAIAGLSWTLIHAGACKADGNPHQPLSPDVAAPPARASPFRAARSIPSSPTALPPT